ncbi:hypothetical protein BT96DRAFT_1009554 [Gymnopus androsaceus JB14]|uniref:Large ribosomal subunit protein uL10-like insertion domain-containing protein n=1 Tax=Gymnopus androsaceus JB14 TaxID=1447944 RepID=A0A6A4GCJ1_9AGAR|nr:hypothetical protein BT96DRAFT_1009554 [Gymnopus androsaceus JB14]
MPKSKRSKVDTLALLNVKVKYILFTDTEPQKVIEWFADFSQPAYGNIASRTVILPVGPVMRHHSDPPETFPQDSQLRKLGLTTTMNRGVPTLQSAHKLCKKGKVLTADCSTTGDVTQIEGPRLAQDEVSDAANDDEAMCE